MEKTRWLAWHEAETNSEPSLPPAQVSGRNLALSLSTEMLLWLLPSGFGKPWESRDQGVLWELIVFADVGGAVRVAHMECGVYMAPLAAGKGSRCKGVIPIISQPGDCFWGYFGSQEEPGPASEAERALSCQHWMEGWEWNPLSPELGWINSPYLQGLEMRVLLQRSLLGEAGTFINY